MDQAVTELKELNRKADTIIGIMRQPENRALRLIEILGNAAGIVGILAVVDIIRNWILGG